VGIVDTGRCVGVTLDMQLDWSADINDVGKTEIKKRGYSRSSAQKETVSKAVYCL
jgi:hypothetical protein